MHDFNIPGIKIEYKTPHASECAHSSNVYLPKNWHGKKVAVVLLESLE